MLSVCTSLRFVLWVLLRWRNIYHFRHVDWTNCLSGRHRESDALSVFLGNFLCLVGTEWFFTCGCESAPGRTKLCSYRRVLNCYPSRQHIICLTLGMGQHKLHLSGYDSHCDLFHSVERISRYRSPFGRFWFRVALRFVRLLQMFHTCMEVRRSICVVGVYPLFYANAGVDESFWLSVSCE